MENICRRYLNSRLWQVDLKSDLFSHEDIGVSRLLEERLQHIQLLSGGGGPLSLFYQDSHSLTDLITQRVIYMKMSFLHADEVRPDPVGISGSRDQISTKQMT